MTESEADIFQTAFDRLKKQKFLRIDLKITNAKGVFAND
jgi:hypothetical protein